MGSSSIPCAVSSGSRLAVAALSTLLLGIALWFAVTLTLDVRALQADRTALAELRDVQYGLFNAELWVEQLGAILARKIDHFAITEANRPQLKRAIEQLLDRLLVEIEGYLHRRNASGNWLERVQGGLQQRVQDWLIDFNRLRARVPEYADQLLLELQQPRTRAELKGYLDQRLNQAAANSLADVDYRAFNGVLAHYGCETGVSCAERLSARIKVLEARSRQQAVWVLGLITALFAVQMALTRRARHVHPQTLGLLSAAVLTLLAIGVLTPMLDIEARISELSFQLLGEPVRFTDQVLYFQSKSLLEVVTLLARAGTADMLLVAGLLTLFSLVFPILKILASGVYYAGARGSALIGFFALRSGKWSMADVLVVALFMAYIGFDGLISSQLQALAGSDPGLKVLTTNGTRLGIGFYMFLSFVLGSLIISTLLDSERQST